MGDKFVADSVKARHILIKADNGDTAKARATADSLKDAIQKGASFADLATKFSQDPGSAVKGGDLGWFRLGVMVPSFNDACFNGKKGDMPIVSSQFGVHLIEIMDKGAPSRQVQIATIERKIEPSQRTYDDFFNRASQFAASCTSPELFDSLIIKQSTAKRIADNIRESDNNVPGLEQPRELVRWAYGANKGDIAISAQSGLLINTDRTAFENSRKISMLVFDKTGTLTKGEFNVVRYEGLDGKSDKEQVLQLAAALEQNSEHPIATGIVRKAKELNLPFPKLSDFKAITGKGIEAKVDGNNIRVVSPGYLKENNIAIDQTASSKAETVVFVLFNHKVLGLIALADEIRPESAEAIKVLHSQNIKSLLLTGDNKEVAKIVSESLGMDGFIAEVLPHQKLEKIKELQQKRDFVAMTGDGVNDAPALVYLSHQTGFYWCHRHRKKPCACGIK